MLKTQVSGKFLLSEVNILIQHILVKDQDGQNNNIRVSMSYLIRNEQIII